MSRLFRFSILLSFFFAIDKLLGILRQVIIAQQFGLSSELDAFNAANNIPDLLFALISGGSLAFAFIPILSESLALHGRRELWNLFSRVANLALLVTAGLSVLVALLADKLVGWQLGVAPGFGPDLQHLVADLMRLNLLATLIFAISGLVMAGLQANQHFLLPAMASAIYDVGQIFGALVLAPTEPYTLGPITLPAYGMGIHGLVYGVIFGAMLHLGIQIPGLLAYKFRWIPSVRVRDPGVMKVLYLLGPRLMSMFFIQLIFIARDNLASRLQEGAVTALTYGWLIMQVPETLIGTAIATAMLPTLSELSTLDEVGEFRTKINRALRAILALTFPSAALLAVSLPSLVSVLHFDEAGTALVVWTTRAYLVGLMGHSLLEIAARAFYALQNARPPLFASMMHLLVYIPVAALTFRRIGPAGIASADALAFTGEALLLLYLLNRRMPGLLSLGTTLYRVIPASLGGALIVLALMRVLPLPPLFAAAGALAAGGVTVLPFIWPEVKMLIKL